MSASNAHDLTQTFRVGGRKSAAQRFGDQVTPAPDPAGADPAGADPAGADPAGADPHRARRPVARLVSAVLEPVWYWLDLFGPDDHPSNAKIVATASIAVGLVILLVLAGGMAAKGTTPDEWFVVLALGLIGGAAGWDLMKSRGKTRAAIDVLRSGVAPAEPAPPPPGAP